jgi:alpha-mannosidase
VIVESVKLADDRSGDVVVRIYEARGARARTVIRTGFDVADVHSVDLLERRLDALALTGSAVEVELRPFQILTLRFSRSAAGRP